MSHINITQLTDRQKRELEYHRHYAQIHKDILNKPFPWDVLNNPAQRWWNAYWQMYAYLVKQNLNEKKVLVVGCGFGDDALRLAKLGADVSAFDLSPDALAIAQQLAEREQLTINFQQMAAEQLSYPDNTFDYIIARDILHHVDIPTTLQELVRIAKPNALFVVNEIYSHSLTDRIRYSTLVTQSIYPRMQKLIYGTNKPYITQDERKLSEHDITAIMQPLQQPEMLKHFNFLTTRIFPDSCVTLAKLDRCLLMIFKRLGAYMAGRILFTARVSKPT